MEAPIFPGRRALLFVRHGETEYNRCHRRCGGDVDIALTEQGIAQARQAGQRLRTQPDKIDAIIASPLLRTRRTAELILAEISPCPLLYHDGLIERRLGAWNGLDITASQAFFDAGLPPPGGEAEEVFRARIRQTVADILALPYRLPLLVASKGVARVLALFGGSATPTPANNAEIIRFDFAGPP